MQNFLTELKIDDSKKMTDDYIKKVAPKVMEKIPYTTFILTNQKYNALDHDKVNMNKIKAILHNKVLFNLKNKGFSYDKIIVDQFTPPKNYYNYLSDVPNKVTDITFVTKAESKFLSVACASVISRYVFLLEMQKMSEQLGEEIPKGAGEAADKFASNLVKNKGKAILNDIAKLNFKNTEKGAVMK